MATDSQVPLPATRCREKGDQMDEGKAPYRVIRRIAATESPDEITPSSSSVHMLATDREMARACMIGRSPTAQPTHVINRLDTPAPNTDIGPIKRAPYRAIRRCSKESMGPPRKYVRRFSEEIVRVSRQHVRRFSEEALKIPGDFVRNLSVLNFSEELPREYIRRLSEEMVEVVVYSETGMMHLFDKIPNWMFPFHCSTIEGFVSLNFWYSIVLTVGTPLHRFLYGQWHAVNHLHQVINLVAGLFGYSTNLEEVALYYPIEGSAAPTVPGSGSPSPAPKSIEGLDRGFVLHAACGLLWLVTAWLQMTFFRTYKGGRLHRKFGYVTLGVFVLHMAACAHNIWVDAVVHKPIIKMALASVGVVSSVYLAQGIFYAVRRGDDWRSKHEDSMIRCFLYSIEGSGPIRVVGGILHNLGFGPLRCQNIAGSLATNCVRDYMIRLMAVRCWTMFVMGGYARMVGRRDFISVYLRETALLLMAFAGMLVAHVLEYVFGLDLSSFASELNTERSALGNLSVLCTGVVYAGMVCAYLLAPFMSHQMQLAEEFDKMWRKSWQERQPSFRHSFVNKPDSAKSLRPSASASAPRANWRTKWATESSLARKAPPPPHSPAPRSTPSLPLSIKRVVSAPLTPGPSPVLDPNSNLKQD